MVGSALDPGPHRAKAPRSALGAAPPVGVRYADVSDHGCLARARSRHLESTRLTRAARAASRGGADPSRRVEELRAARQQGIADLDGALRRRPRARPDERVRAEDANIRRRPLSERRRRLAAGRGGHGAPHRRAAHRRGRPQLRVDEAPPGGRRLLGHGWRVKRNRAHG